MTKFPRNFLFLSAAVALSFYQPASASSGEPTSEETGAKKQDIGQLYDRLTDAYRANDLERALKISDTILTEIAASSGKQTQVYAFALNSHGSTLSGLGRDKEAKAFYKQSWDIYRQVLGPSDAATLRSLNNYATALDLLGETEKAEPLHKQVLDKRRAQLGATHPDSLLSLNNYAFSVYRQGRYAEAEKLFAEVIGLNSEANGAEDPSTLIAMNNHASVLQELGRFAEAEKSYRSILETRRRTLGTDHPDTIVSLGNLASSLQKMGRLREAEPLFAETMKLSETVKGKQHPSTLISRNNYAAVLEALGQLQEAEKLYASVLADRRASLGERHPNTLISLANYAVIQTQLGRTFEAEPLFAQALQLGRELYGNDHPVTLNLMNNYASVLNELDRPQDAEPLYREAHKVRVKALGEKHPDSLHSLNSLGTIAVALGKVDEAEQLFARTLELRREVLGNDHPETIVSLNNYAVFINAQGRSEEAEPLYAEALALNRKALGDAHPNTITSLNNYAYVLDNLRKFSDAEKLYEEAVKLSRAALGEGHIDVLAREGNLAFARLSQPDRAALAIEPARRAAGGFKLRSFLGLNPRAEAQQERDQKRQRYYFQLLANAAWSAKAAAGLKGKSDLRREAFVALQDAMTDRTTTAIAKTAARRVAAEAGEALGDLANERQSLSDRWLELEERRTAALSLSDEDASSARAAIRQEQDDIVRKIAAISLRLRDEAPDYLALIRPEPLRQSAAQSLVGKEDAALLVVPSEFGTHVMALTGDGLSWHRSDWSEAQINAAVKRLLWDVGANVDVDQATDAEWQEEGEGPLPFDRGTAHALYQQIIAPVADALNGKRHLFIAARGALSSLPFGLLVTENPEGADGDPSVLRNTKWFADAHALVQIPSLQSLQFLRRFRADIGDFGSKPSFKGFGDPVLEGKATRRGGGKGRLRGGTAAIAASAAFREDQSRSGSGLVDIAAIKKLARLPGTASEIRALGKAFGASGDNVFLGSRATEENLRGADLSETNILALATHGLLAGEIEGAREPGLVFTPPDQPSEADDGLLTASEVAALRLNAEWVILSACNTAAGDGSEGAPGLSGLARSFFFAGARNLLASHWPVGDEIAAKMTVRTVEIARENRELSRAEAFQQAMREIRNDPAADGPENTWAHPRAWAPFVLIGDR